MSATNLELPYSIDPKNPFLVDKRSGPWASVNAANAGIPEAVRVRGLVVIVLDAVVGYYYKDGVADINLVPINTDESAIWGQITGVLSNQTDLQAALDGKEDDITPGTTLQFWRGDKTWQTLNTAVVPESGSLYFTQARARQSLDITTTGNNGAATYNSALGVFNIPAYTLNGLGGVPSSRLINGLDLSADRTFSTSDIAEGSRQYFTSTRARTSISLTTVGTGGLSTYDNTTGVLNIPNYTVTGLGAEPSIIAGNTLQYWRGDKTWQTLNTTIVPEGTNEYFTQAKARSAISITTTGTSGSAVYSPATGVLNVPSYTLSGLGGETAITPGSILEYWRGDKTWQTLNSDAVPEATAKYYTDARVLAYGNTQWARLDGSYTNPSWLVSLPWSKITNTPTTLGGYGITDAFTETEADARFVKKAGDIMTGTLLIAAPASIDSSLVPGEDILNLGTANASVINIGWSGATINIQGSVMWQDVDNLAVTDKLIRLNKGGAAASGVSSGFEIEENAVITGWLATDSTRTGWDLKAPASQQLTLGLDLLTASRTIKVPNLTGTLLIDSGTYNDPAWLATLAWSKITGTPTTLSGYGITNAYTKTETDSLLSAYTPMTRQLTINGVTQDLLANRTWNVGTVTSVGLAVPIGFTSGAAVSSSGNLTLGFDAGYSLPTNVKQGQWDTAYGWGNHAGLYSLLGHTHTFSSLTSKPTTLAGYGITDAATSAQGTKADTAYSWGDHSLVGYFLASNFNSSFDTRLALKSTTDLAEGINLYYTQGRFDSAFALKSTTNLAEGTNLYYTGARFNTAFAAKSTSDLSEGTNLYYTDARTRAAISETITGIDYNNTTGVFSLTSGYVIPTTTQETNWNLAYTQTRQWDGGATGLVAATGRASLGLVIGVDVLAYRTFGTAANNNTGDFATAAQGTKADTAFSWGNHAGLYSLLGHIHDDRYYTETEIQNFFSGASAMTGYSKVNWDAVYAWYQSGPLTGLITAAHQYYIGTTLNALNRSSAAQTLTGVSIDGNAGNANLWNGWNQDYSIALSTAPSGLFGYNSGTATQRIYNATALGLFLGLGSAAYTASSAYYAAGSTVANSTLWNGLAIALMTYASGTVPSALIYNSTNSRVEFATWAQYQSFLGLGSMAYASTSSYVPYSGAIASLNMGVYGVFAAGFYSNNYYTSAGASMLVRSGNYNMIYTQAANIGIYLGGAVDPANYYDNTTHFFRNIGGGATYATIQNGMSTFYGETQAYNIDNTNRTTYRDILYVTAQNGALPYTGHGGGILFRGSTYQNSGVNVPYARIGTIINSDSVNSYGSTMFFDIATNSSGSTARAFELYWTGRTKWFYNAEINGSDRILELKSPGGGNNSLLRYSDGSTAKFSTGFNNSNYIIYDDAANIHRFTVTSTGIVRVNSGTSFNVEDARTLLGYTSPGLSYTQASAEIYSSGTYGPRLSFHWGGVVASQIGVESDGTIVILNNPGSAYERLKAGNGIFTGNLSAFTINVTQGVTIGDGYGLNAGNFQVGAITSNRFYIYNNVLGLDNISIAPSTGITTFARGVVGTSATFSSTITAGAIGANIRLTGDGGVGNDGFIGADNSGNLFFRNWIGSRGFYINTSNALLHGGNITAASMTVSSGGTLEMVSGDVWIKSEGYGILSANANRAIAIQNSQITLNYYTVGTRTHLEANGTSDYVFKAAATNVGSTKYILLAGVTGVSNGFTVTHNGTNMVYNMAGGRLTVEDTVIAPNFADGFGSFNVNLGSGGSEGRGLVAGYSGGNYGGIGYNIRHTGSSSTWIAPGGDSVSYLIFNAGFTFSYAPGGAAGRDISGTLGRVAYIDNQGGLNTKGAIFPGYNNNSLAEQSSYYIQGWTAGGGLRTNGDWIVAGEVEATTYYTATDNYYRAMGGGGMYWQTHTTRLLSRNSSYVETWSNAGIQLRNTSDVYKGSLYYDGGGLGLLNDQGGWSLRVYPGAGYGGMLYGDWTLNGLLTLDGASTGNNTYNRLNRNAITTESMFMWATAGIAKWYLGQRSFASEDGFSIFSASAAANVLYFAPSGVATFNSSVFATQFTTSGWFYNSTSNVGLTNSANSTHFSSSSSYQWDIAGSQGAYLQVALRVGGHGSTVRGYLYADSTNNIGLLTSDANWGLRMNSSKTAIIMGGITDLPYHRFLNPRGGSLIDTSSSRTGAIKIRMPNPGSSPMMMGKLNVYEYVTGRSFTLTFAGHTSGTYWYNTTAYWDTQNDDRNITVRFGIEGGYYCVWIGETGTTWSYPQVWLTDVQIGYSSISETWATDWVLSFETSLGSISQTHTLYGASTTGGPYTPVRRDSSGYIFNSYFNTSSGGAERNTSGMGYFAGFNSSDYYIRSYTPTAARIAMGLATTDNVTFNQVTATNGGFNSDLTLKNVIGEGSLLNIADQNKVIRFTWKDQAKGTGMRYGYGAQYIQALIPEAVYVTGDGTLAVDYTQVHTVLIDENTRRIKALEAEVAELKKQLNRA